MLRHTTCTPQPCGVSHDAISCCLRQGLDDVAAEIDEVREGASKACINVRFVPGVGNVDAVWGGLCGSWIMDASKTWFQLARDHLSGCAGLLLTTGTFSHS